MKDWIVGLFGGVIKAGAMALARHGATLAGTAILTWLLSHHVSADLAQRLVGDLEDALLTATGVSLAAAGIGASLKDVKSVGGKMAVAASAGYDKGQAQALQQAMQQGVEAQAATDQAKIAAVADAMKQANAATKTDKASIVQALKDGVF